MHAYFYSPARPDAFGLLGNDSLYLDNSKLGMLACALAVGLAAATWRLWKDRERSR